MANKSLTFNIFGHDKTASKAIKGVGNSTGLLEKQFKKLGGVIVGAFAVKRIVSFAKVAVQEFAEAEQGQNRLTDAFERFPKAANTNIVALRKLNTVLQNKTKFDDDALAAAQAQLLQYNLTGKQVEKLTPLLADFAAKTGKDLPTAAGLLGKALLGQGKGLKAIGVNFKDAGSVTANYAQLIDILTGKVGGFAEKEGKTFSGQLEILNNQFGELKERVGSVFAPALGLLADLMATRVLPLFDKLVDKVGPKLEKFFEAGAGKLGDFLDAVSTGATTGDWKPLTDFLTAATPALPIVAAGMDSLGKALSDPDVQAALTKLVVDGLPPLIDLIVALTPLIIPLADALSTSLVPNLTAAGKSIEGLGVLFSGNIDDQRAWLRSVIAMGGPIGFFVGQQAQAVAGLFNFVIGAANAVTSAIETVVNALTFLTGVSLHLPRLKQVTVGGLLLGGGATPFNTNKSGGGPKGINGGMFAEGGIVPARPGGMLGVIGEGKHDEAVIPLSSRVLGQLGGGGGGDIHIHISGVVAATKNELAKTIRQTLVDGRRTGAIPAGAI